MPKRRLKISTVPVVSATFGISLALSKWFPVTIGDHGWNLVISVWPGDKAMEWQHSSSPCPKKFWVQKSTGKVLALIIWNQDGLLLIDYLQKGQTINAEYYSSLLVHLKDILKEKRHQGGLVLARQCPGLPSTCNPEETFLPGLPMSCSPTLCSGSGPIGLPPVPWNEKNNWEVAIFHPTWRSLLPRRCGWTDKLLNFFWVACKSYSNGLRSVLSFVGSVLNKSRAWSL